jgi:hypothetical protein
MAGGEHSESARWHGFWRPRQRGLSEELARTLSQTPIGILQELIPAAAGTETEGTPLVRRLGRGALLVHRHATDRVAGHLDYARELATFQPQVAVQARRRLVQDGV